MDTAGQNVKNEVINLHCYLSDKVIHFHICVLSQLCYVYVEVSTYEFRPYLFYLVASLQVQGVHCIISF